MSTYIPLGVSIGVVCILNNVLNDPRAATALATTDRTVILMTMILAVMIGVSATVITHAIRSRP